MTTRTIVGDFDPDDYVSVEELADLLETTKAGVYMRRIRGQLPDDWVRVYNMVFWPRHTVETWMEGPGAQMRAANILHREQRKYP